MSMMNEPEQARLDRDRPTEGPEEQSPPPFAEQSDAEAAGSLVEEDVEPERAVTQRAVTDKLMDEQ